MSKVPGAEVVLKRTVSGEDLWLSTKCLPYHDGRMWVVLLHCGIGPG